MAIHIHINTKDKRIKDAGIEEYRGYKIKQNSLNGKWYILDPKGTGYGKIGHVMGFNTLPEAKKKLDEHID